MHESQAEIRQSKPTFDDNQWYKDAVFYEVPIRSFYDSNGDGFGDIRGLIDKLDYIKRLGVDCIWLLPMYPSPLLDDGYDISHFRTLHPDLGTIDDFRDLIDAAHRMDLKVVTDLVMNHTSDQHEWFQDSRAGVSSPKRDFYVWTDDPTTYGDTRIIFLDTETSNWTFDPLSEQYYWHRFYRHQPDLNYANREVWQEMFEIVRFWLSMGLDGFRCDAVPYLYEREGTHCENLPETHMFLQSLRKMVDAEFPGTLLLAEANQWPEDVIPYFGTAEHPEFHMGFHFPVMPRIYMALKREERAPIVDILRLTPDIPDDCQWAMFLRNHDELTLEMVTLDERHFMWDSYAPDPRMRLNLGIRRRLAPLMDNNRPRLELIHAILLSLPGSPCLYYGDEIGMGDNIWLRDRNGVRTPMQWSADGNAGFSTSESLWAPVVSDEEFGYSRVNVAAQETDEDSLMCWLTRMLAIRKLHRSFGRGTLEFVFPESPALLVFTRDFDGDCVLFVGNLSDRMQETSVPLGRFVGRQVTDLLTGQRVASISRSDYPLTLAPSEFRWLQIS